MVQRFDRCGQIATGTSTIVTQALTKDIGNGYTRIRMTAPSGLVVNAWLLQNQGHAVLFDSGFPFTTDQLKAGLAEAGLTIQDIESIAYTHTHVDHIGGGIALNPELRCRNLLWQGTHPRLYTAFYDVLESFEPVADWIHDFLPESEENSDVCAKIAEIPEGPTRCAGDGSLDRVEFVEIDEELTLAGRRFKVIDARGHDIYHIGWLDTETNTLISGDVILRVPTPILLPMYDNMLIWLRTLRQWETTLDSPQLLPGHGMATTLFGPAIERSRLVIQRLLEASQSCMEDGLPMDPLTIIEAYSGYDRSRYAQRFTVILATLGSLLHLLEQQGYVRSLDTRHWVLLRSLPALEIIETWSPDGIAPNVLND